VKAGTVSQNLERRGGEFERAVQWIADDSESSLRKIVRNSSVKGLKEPVRKGENKK
jgi:hypothetical protein